MPTGSLALLQVQWQAVPAGVLVLLLAIAGCGFWAGLASRRRVVGALLVCLAGMAAGVLTPYVSLYLPTADLGLPLVILAVSVLVALRWPATPLVPAGMMLAVGVLVGLRLPFTWEVETWAGFACGTLIAAALGVGLTAMVKRPSAAPSAAHSVPALQNPLAGGKPPDSAPHAAATPVKNGPARSAKPAPRKTVDQALRPMRLGFFWTGLFSAFVNLLMLVSPVFMMVVFDRVLSSQRVETLYFLTLIALVAFVAYGALEWLRGKVLARTGAWLEDTLARRTLLAALFARLRGTPGTGQAVRDLQQVRTFLSAPSMFPFFDAPWIPIFLAALWLLHPWIGIFATTMAVILLVIALIGELSTRKHQARTLEQVVIAQRQVDAAIDQSEAVTALGMRQPLADRWDEARHEASEMQRGLNERSALVTGIAKGLRQMVQVGILALGAWLVLQGQLTAGGMIAGSILLGRALAPIDQSITAWRGFTTARQAWQRLKSVLLQVPDRADPMPLPAPKGWVGVENVGYRPPSAAAADAFLLHGISFALRGGEAMGIVGPSGAGKSTLCRMIAGLYPPTMGKVTFDGASIDQWDPDVLGAHIGYLPQDVGLPPATVAETISRLRDAQPEMVIDAARKAGAHELIVSLPGGYDTPVGAGGVPLSGGQRQRIGLARALFGNPSLVILDEAAAHLDQEGEGALQRAIVDLKARKTTVIMIAHRPSLVRHMDKLLVLQQGGMTRFGNRKEVLAAITPQAVPARTGT